MDRNAIGRESKAAVNEVEKGAIRRVAEALGETNPIYFEEAAARAAGYRCVVAPPTFPTTLRAGSDLREGLLLSPGKHLLQAEQSFEYARPIVAGDKLTVRSKVVEVSQRITPSGLTVLKNSRPIWGCSSRPGTRRRPHRTCRRRPPPRSCGS